MQIIADIEKWTNLILMTVVIGAGIIGVLFYYYVKVKKPSKEEEQNEKYANIKREDAKEYLPIDDIDDDMIITQNKTVFIGAILCKGYDFYSSPLSEQKNTVSNYIGFINTINGPIQKRITTKAVDLEIPIKKHENARNKVKAKLSQLYEEAIILEQNYEQASGNEKVLFHAEIERVDRSIKNTIWQIEHIDHLIEYLKSAGSKNAVPVREEVYLFEWVYDPANFYEGITEREIYERATSEINNLAMQYSHALANAGVKCQRATTEDLREMVRQHMHPYGVDAFKRSNINESGYDEMIITSNSLEELEQKYKEAYARQLSDAIQRGFTVQ